MPDLLLYEGMEIFCDPKRDGCGARGIATRQGEGEGCYEWTITWARPTGETFTQKCRFPGAPGWCIKCFPDDAKSPADTPLHRRIVEKRRAAGAYVVEK